MAAPELRVTGSSADLCRGRRSSTSNDKDHSPLPLGLEFPSPGADHGQWQQHFALAGEQIPPGVCFTSLPSNLSVCQSVSTLIPCHFWMISSPNELPHTSSLHDTYLPPAFLLYVNILQTITSWVRLTSFVVPDSVDRSRPQEARPISISLLFFSFSSSKRANEIAEPCFIRARPDKSDKLERPELLLLPSTH